MGMIADIEHMNLYLGITIPCSLSQPENPSKFGEIHGDAMPFPSGPAHLCHPKSWDRPLDLGEINLWAPG